MSKTLKISIILISLLTIVTWSEVVAAPPLQGGGNSGGSLIHLQYATFDPVQSLPTIPQSLDRQNYSGKAGPYIVQFQGPVKSTWKDAVVAAGGQIDSYLPDYAFIVKMDAKTRAQVERFSFVRWVGIYQPAYKMSPGLMASPINRYRVRLARWSDAEQVRNQLSSLSGNVRGSNTSLVVSAQFDQIPQIAQLSDVLWIEEFQFFEKQNDIAAGIMNAATPWASGYTGNGQIVTIADSGLDTGVDNPGVNDDIHRDFDNRVAEISSWPVVPDPGCVANSGSDDGAADEDSGHGTHVAGSVGSNGARSGGQYKGIAHQATLSFQAIEQFTTWTGICDILFSEGFYLTGIPDDLNDLFQEAYNWGARIHTNSWGSNVDGEYTMSSQHADEFTWNHKDFTILFAAGNDGEDANGNGYVDEDSIGSPATAKNVITIGASENNRSSGGYNPGGPCWLYGNCWPSDFPDNPTSSDQLSDDPDEMAAFSSRGPTDDGRIKPDLVAPGTNILSTRSSQAAGELWGDGPTSYYVYSGGTSMATPLAAGVATVVRDYLVDGEGYANPSSALIKALLINSAVDINGYGVSGQEAGQPIPNNHEGWGRIDLAAATNGTNRVFVDDQSLTTSTTHVYSFTNTSAATPLKASLVWTDYPGDPSAGTQLVNNLNLRVIAPNGTTTYRGNNFSNGWSTSGGSSDTINNVENVYIQSPEVGLWTIEVTGLSVPVGPQPYALVVAGQGTLSEPSSGPGSGSKIYLPLILKSELGSACIADPAGESNNVNGALTVCSGQTVSGQVSRPGDIDDVYKISVSADQVVTISMNGSGGDADLFLYPPGTTDVTTDPWAANSSNAGNNEFIQGTALVGGFWYIDIFSYSGTTNYNVTVTLTSSVTGSAKTFDLSRTDPVPDRRNSKTPN